MRPSSAHEKKLGKALKVGAEGEKGESSFIAEREITARRFPRQRGRKSCKSL